MRVFVLLGVVLSFSLAASAADLKVKVLDPQSATVGGAEVSLLGTNDGRVLATQNTSAEGVAVFRVPGEGSFQIQVLAPGFAAETLPVSSQAEITVNLRLATASETVVVSGMRTPVTAQAAGADVDSLSAAQLTTIQPLAASDAIRFLPGAVVNAAGQRGGLTSLFVRGGESRYNKVIVDGVTINEPGGTFDFGTLRLDQADRLEFVRGAQSTLYGSDAMTSVVQVWTQAGNTRVPELSFGADGGNFGTARGYAALAGARGRFDYNLFGSQLNTNGAGVNNAYSDSLEGANVGVALNDVASLRVRVRHANSHTGVGGEWNFNGYNPIVSSGTGPSYPLPPNPYDWSQLNNLLGSAELTVVQNRWQHRFTGFDYLYRYYELNPGDANRVSPIFGQFDFASNEVDHINRAGFEYQGDYSERSWAHTTFGYRVENENGFVGNLAYGAQNHDQRLSNEIYAQQAVTWKTLSAIVGGRFVHNSTFGNIGVPRVALTWQALRGSEIFSGTRLRFSYATAFKEPRLEETFNGIPPNLFNRPNTGLRPEHTRAFEAGFQQDLMQGKYVFTATYFNNLFQDQINYVEVDPVNFVGEYVNVNRALAHGAEVGVQAKLMPRLLLNAAYTYTSTQILENPAPINSLYDVGEPLLRRPKNSATALLSYLGTRWGGSLAGSFVGQRPDSDFLGFDIDHAAGYVRVDFGGWYAVRPRVTLYANVENGLDRRYNEVVGYPALPLNFRAGMRFRIGGE
jgi:outer membrane cobalamin receptor